MDSPPDFRPPPLSASPSIRFIGKARKTLRTLFTDFMKMVQLEGESSNSLFAILQEWETILQTCDPPSNTVTQDNDPGCGDEHFGT